MKGIILAGGSGTRLYPSTLVTSKQLLPVYDKPMIYYPLSILMLSGIKEILIISTPKDLPLFEKLFGTGEELGLKFSYAEQPSPDGLAQAFIIGEKFIGNDDVCMVLGDNIFYGDSLTEFLHNAANNVKVDKNPTIFGYHVADPERYGVVDFNQKGEVLSIEEKPQNPKSNFAIPGLYYYTNDVVQIAKTIKPSARGELEITSVNQKYLEEKRLKVELIGRGYVWLDAGTPESLSDASDFVKIMERRMGVKLGCIEEIAYKLGLIDKSQLIKLGTAISKSEYGKYLLRCAESI